MQQKGIGIAIPYPIRKQSTKENHQYPTASAAPKSITTPTSNLINIQPFGFDAR